MYQFVRGNYKTNRYETHSDESMFSDVSRFRLLEVGSVVALLLAAIVDTFLLHDFNEFGPAHVLVFSAIILTYLVWKGVRGWFAHSE